MLTLATTYALNLVAPLLADAKESFAWAIVVLLVVLGMMVTLQPVKRSKEVKGRIE